MSQVYIKDDLALLSFNDSVTSNDVNRPVCVDDSVTPDASQECKIMTYDGKLHSHYTRHDFYIIGDATNFILGLYILNASAFSFCSMSDNPWVYLSTQVSLRVVMTGEIFGYRKQIWLHVSTL